LGLGHGSQSASSRKVGQAVSKGIKASIENIIILIYLRKQPALLRATTFNKEKIISFKKIK